MSALQLVNRVPASIASSAEFRVSQGTTQVARIGVHAGGMAAIPTSETWQVQATMAMSDLTFTSNTVDVALSSASLYAQLLMEGGLYAFQLFLGPGALASMFTLHNTVRVPVTFLLTQTGSPNAIKVVVQENETGQVSTVQQWTVYAIVNGITTETAWVTNPNATVTVTADNQGDGFALAVS